MKNFFENKLNKGNPFIDRKDKKGENLNIMTDEIKENDQDIIEDQEKNKDVENASKEAKIAEENTDKESEKLKQDFENLNNQYLRILHTTFRYFYF